MMNFLRCLKKARRREDEEYEMKRVMEVEEGMGRI